MALSDTDLMLLVKNGDDQAFSELVIRYEKRIINFFYRLIFDYQKSEDLTQELFLKLYRYRRKYADTASFQTFIFRIARNLWIDYLRKHKNKFNETSLNSSDVSIRESGMSLRNNRTFADPSVIMERRDLQKLVIAAVQSLTQEEQMILTLSIREKMKYKEIGRILNVPEGTVKSKVFYAYRRLRNKLGDIDLNGM